MYPFLILAAISFGISRLFGVDFFFVFAPSYLTYLALHTIYERPELRWECYVIAVALLLIGFCIKYIYARLSDKSIATFISHKISVTSVEFSPIDALLASGSWDGTIELWSLEKMELVCTFPGHSKTVNSIAFSPSGKLLASGSNDGTVKLWDVDKHELLQTLSGAKTWIINSVVWSPDGLVLACGCRDGDAVLTWQKGNGDALELLDEGFRGSIVSFNFDGSLLAATSNTAGTSFWSMTNHKIVKQIPKAAGRASALRPDGAVLATGGSISNAKKIELWNVTSAEKRKIIKGHRNTITCLAFDLSGQVIASGSKDWTVRLWASKTMRTTLSGHTGTVNAVKFSPDGRLLASCSSDRKIKIWQIF
ncbi:WD40 repeat domain-containing protein [Candidatus Bipolaricaulota bacterium]|nr:WD40 repeat domain-containing protein [Candidatus Bipolaricaulota bacterium]